MRYLHKNVPKTNGNLLDLIGIGIGPSNLSLAALLSPFEETRSRFYDLKETFEWYPGMLFKDATIQVSFLKDLVSLVDPTNPYTFINFLAKHKRLYRFVTAKFQGVRRREFNQYFQWVANDLQNLQFNSKVLNVDFNGEFFEVTHSEGIAYAKNLVLGTGLREKIPPQLRPFLSPTVFHAVRYLKIATSLSGKRVTVIGGGQSGAEVVKAILSQEDLPESLSWVSGRHNLLPIDDSPFTNEYFFPPYSDYFFRLEQARKNKLNKDLRLASDGINPDLLEHIYQRLYEIELVDGKTDWCKLYVNEELYGFEEGYDGWKVTLKNKETQEFAEIDTDIVISATGFEYKCPPCLSPLVPHIHQKENSFVFNDDFSLCWDGPKANKIYLQNGARHTRGVADPNLSLMAWRSARIVNSLLEREAYDLEEESTALQWPTGKEKDVSIDSIINIPNQ